MTFGYCLEAGTAKIAYLCDTIGLPPGSRKFLKDSVILAAPSPHVCWQSAGAMRSRSLTAKDERS